MSASPAMQNRWIVKGFLALDTSMRIGSGEADAIAETGEDVPTEISCIQRDLDGCPMIPGSSLKGVLRHQAVTRYPELNKGDPTFVGEIFGVPSKEGDEGQGGRIEILDARMTELPEAVMRFEGYDQERVSTVETAIAIDRGTGAVEGRKLFARDHVPAGAIFQVEFRADNLNDAQMAFFLALLNGFERREGTGVNLGGGGTAGRGLARWRLSDCRKFDREALKVYLEGDGTVLWSEMETVDALATFPELEEEIARFGEAYCPVASIEIAYTLHFESPFLVAESVKAENEGDPQTAPRARANPKARAFDDMRQGLPDLPSSSVRGALRAWSERILSTLAGHERDAGLLFGEAGNRGALEVRDLRPAPSWTIQRESQEFVAVDRFTGGAADGLKFTVESLRHAAFDGELVLDATKAGVEGVGLLALVLRDLVEGELTFGHGASKGYGACRGEIRSIGVFGKERVDGAPGELLADLDANCGGDRPWRAENNGLARVLAGAAEALVRHIEDEGAG